MEELDRANLVMNAIEAMKEVPNRTSATSSSMSCAR
jgi:hypothetical protein